MRNLFVVYQKLITFVAKFGDYEEKNISVLGAYERDGHGAKVYSRGF